MKRFVVLIDRLGSVILPGLRMKRQLLHCLRAHLKVWGSSSDVSTLLTRKFLMFFPRLNEISGNCERFYLFHCHIEMMFLAAGCVDDK